MRNKHETKREVSIVIPTYNRRELVEFTLYSLFEQSIAPNRYEVIVVNGGSSDDTSKLLSTIKTPYRLKAVNYEPNRGVAYSRNQGVKEATGEIIIFLDEMLVDEGDIAAHLKRHSRDSMVITSAYNGKNIFTHYYEQFPGEIKEACLNLRQLPAAGWYPSGKEGVFRLFQPQQVVDHSVLQYGYDDGGGGNYVIGQLKKMHGPFLQEMNFPWIFCITNSLSVQQSLLEKAGLFDENFLKGGFEDHELGYRLFQAGGIIENGAEINTYHQNHPVGHDIVSILKNHLYFAHKFPVTEVLMWGIFFAPIMRLDFVGWIKAMSQYNYLSFHTAESYAELLEAFHDLGLTIRRCVEEILKGNEFTPLEDHLQGFARWDSAFCEKVMEQMGMLAQQTNPLGDYGEFLSTFEGLLRLPILDNTRD